MKSQEKFKVIITNNQKFLLSLLRLAIYAKTPAKT